MSNINNLNKGVLSYNTFEEKKYNIPITIIND